MQMNIFVDMFAIQTTDMENYSPTEYQLVSVGNSQLLYLNIDDFIYLRKVNERVPRMFLK